jgi:hypothetical protein
MGNISRRGIYGTVRRCAGSRQSSGWLASQDRSICFRDFFNLFNIVIMGLPANLVNGTGFGEISKTAGTSRQIQFSLKLIY